MKRLSGLKRWLPLFVVAAIVSMIVPIALVGAEPPKTVYFPQTGHHVGEPFLDYWRENGGLPVYGYPLTEAIQEKSATDGNTYLVQYFERARLEYHPENDAPWDILLGHLGRYAAERIVAHPAFNPITAEQATADAVYFPESKHSLRGGFLDYWEEHGGLAQFGYPISEEFVEKSSIDGKNYTVQYFERNRFELHPENDAPWDILLGHLGRQYAQDKRVSTASVPRQAGIPDYADELFFTPTPTPTMTPTPAPKPTDPRPDLGNAYIEVNLSEQHLYVWDGGEMIFDHAVSTGRPGWETPTGVFEIHTYVTIQDMEGGFPKGGPEYYFQPDVPWVMYFDYNGDAIHGVYWHNNFGIRATSHGCVGVPVWVAKWIWDWSNLGTPIWIHY
jgi:lipoprotein-anchoring transpeptidase ErfK/SrfK